MTAAISLRGVGKTYKKAGLRAVPVLQGLNLEVPEGQFLALMGPSGSGKTTILNLMGGIDRADSGEVIVCGCHLERLTSGQLGDWRANNVASSSSPTTCCRSSRPPPTSNCPCC